MIDDHPRSVPAPGTDDPSKVVAGLGPGCGVVSKRWRKVL